MRPFLVRGRLVLRALVTTVSVTVAGTGAAACAARPPAARVGLAPVALASIAPKQDTSPPRTTLTYRRLSDAAPTECPLTPWIEAIGGECARVAPVAITSSAGTDAAPASDQSSCTAFVSGAGAPHELVLELPEGTAVSALVLVAEQTPDGVTSHVVESSDDGLTWSELGTLRGHTVTGHVYAAAARRSRAARFVRVRTVESPSWVAFREVAVLSCARRARLSGTAVPRRSPVDHSGDRWVRGGGACERSADCAMDDCCAARTCVARTAAPRCSGTGCPRVHDDRTVTCACRSGSCGAWVSEGLAAIGETTVSPGMH